MTKPLLLLHDLAWRGITLAREGDRIRAKGPLTPSDRAAIAEAKADLLRLIERQQQAMADIARLPRSSLETCEARVTLALPCVAPETPAPMVRIIPAGTKPDRPGLMHITWPDLADDPQGTLEAVRLIAGAAAIFDGFIHPGR